MIKLHQFGKKVFPDIFLGYELIAAGNWKGDIPDLADLEKLDASEIDPRRINDKEVLITQQDDEFIFSVEMVHQNCQEETSISENPLLGGNRPQGAKIPVENFKANRESLNLQNLQMTLKPVTSSIVITMNLEFNSVCQKKKHSLFY